MPTAMAGSHQLKLQHVMFFSILLLLILPSSQDKPYKYPECRDVPRMKDYYFSASLDAINAAYRVFTESGYLDNITRHQLVNMPSEAQALVYLPHDQRSVILVDEIVDDDTGSHHIVDEVSFKVNFTIQMTTTTGGRIPSIPSSLAFVILPDSFSEYYWVRNASLTQELSLGPGGSLILSDAFHRTDKEVSVTIGRVPFQPKKDSLYPLDHILGVNIAIMKPASANYTVWIEYDHLRHSISVYVPSGTEAGKTRPASPIASLENVSFNDKAYLATQFGILSKMGQFLQVGSWSFWIEGLPDTYAAIYGQKMDASTLEYSVAIVAGIILLVTAAIVGVPCYFRYKQRKWKRELEKLTKIMQSLPGVPTQVDFADIRRATSNFHDNMKLGRGGFGSVYRCELPVPSSTRTTGVMKVAVKMFTRDAEAQRYENFLSEVSIINRLRHKNIVPLVGWSYDQGVPVLIYECMTNGSLDQHLFKRGGSQQHEVEEEDTPRTRIIRQWHTRYSIVRDIATGLHYVHHEHEPTVLHRDIKPGNILLDASFRARLGDFGLACTVAADRNSVANFGGTTGYMAPEYVTNLTATLQTDIFSFGVLILVVVTGKNFVVPPDNKVHISDFVRRLHWEGRLLEALDEHLQDFVEEEAKCLLLLGLACTNSNASSRPSMVEALHVINKVAPPPVVPLERSAFVCPPEEWRFLDSDFSTAARNLPGISVSTAELVQIVQDQPPAETQGTMFFSA